MRLDLATWEEIEAYRARSDGVILPTGSTEQHGPLGLIGTDALCAQAVAERVGEAVGALVAPPLAYAPAPFNMAFPGTVSISPSLFAALARSVAAALARHGLRRIYVLNGHGANIAPLHTVAAATPQVRMRVRSWWAFPAVQARRVALYGDWEGMHATPSEIAMTRALHRTVSLPGLPPPEPLDADYVAAHAGDRHGGPVAHRARFPDGRVGAHSDLGSAEDGAELLDLAVAAASEDYLRFLGEDLQPTTNRK